MSVFSSDRLAFAVLALSLTAPLAASAATIDVLVLYTPGVEAKYSGDPLTRFHHLFNVSNQVYADSDVDLSVRVVGAVKVNYTDGGSANLALDDVTYGRSVFSNVESLRTQYNADMVLLYRVYQSSHGSCGLAWVNTGSNGKLSNSNAKQYMVAHVGIDSCPDHTTVHELGHNMGLNHSRVQDKKGGVYPYALGYGVAGKFTDVMAYTSSFKLDYWTGTVYKLSNPLITCRGLPCGVDRNRADGADAAFAVNLTGPQIANFYGGDTASLRSELQLLAERLMLAEQAHNEAVAARDAQQMVNSQAAAALTRAKVAVDTIKKSSGKSLTTYQTKVSALSKESALLPGLQSKITLAQTKYNTAKTDSARKLALKDITRARSNYDKQASKVQALQAEVNKLSTQLSGVISELNNATAALTRATAQATEEKKKFDAMVARAKTTEASFKSIKAEHDKLAKLASSRRS
jgi:hypothetical protein